MAPPGNSGSYPDPLNRRLFFGTALPVDSFDNLLIAPTPEPAGVTLAVLGAIGLATWRPRWRRA
jgi:hypothetical protein